MAHFTELDQEDLESLSAEFRLGELVRWESVAAGTINSNYMLETTLGTFFLRVNEGKSKSEVALEISVLEHVVEGGVATPLPCQAASGERYALWQDKFVSVFAWEPGSHVDSYSIRVEHCHAAGKALGALHLAGKSMDRKALGEGRYSHHKIKALFESFAGSTESELLAVIPLLRSEFAWLETQESLRSSSARGLIHADLFPDNVLVKGTKVVALLDFEQACGGSLVYDLAVAINAWCFAEALVEERLIALVAGYSLLCPLSAEELAVLVVEVRAAALRFTVTRITDVYLPSQVSSGEAQGKDFRRFLMRLQSWQALGTAGFCRIADLATQVQSP